ncbi:MAG: haloacid dehalogenase type II [Chloroflexota bacterium]
MKLPKYITFDCYGTLIDFQLTKVTVEILGERANTVNLHDFLIVFRDIRYYECLGPFQRYSDLLRTSFKKAMDQCGLRYSNKDGDRLVAAVPTWGPFPDTKPALDHLSQYCKLVIISNAEDDMIAHNVCNIDVPFYDVITAEQARAYKPTTPIFYYALRRLGCDKSDILHVAQGFNYDIMPAHGLGWERVWINRNSRPGNPDDYGPYTELPDLNGLPALLGI